MRKGWIALVVFVGLAAACGGPEVTDIGAGGPTDTSIPGGTTNPGGSPTASGSATGSPTSTGATPLPTLTGVPSFATWQSTIKSKQCTQCHSGGDGGLVYGNATDMTSLKYYWFTSICNRAAAGKNHGVQAYKPTPSGCYVSEMSGGTTCGSDTHPQATVNAGAAITAWMTAAGVTATPPSCSAAVDYVNSQ